MLSAYLNPISKDIAQEILLLGKGCCGHKLKIHTEEDSLPELSNLDIAIFTIGETKRHDAIRKEFYQLYSGNWKLTVADLGNLIPGSENTDTFFAVKQICNTLLKKNVIPLVLGGGHELTYSCYRAFDDLEQTVNLAVVDSKFDLGSIDQEICAHSYLSHIVMEEPNNLFNFSNIGYQTYYNAQEELDLIDSLAFDAYRLGEAKDLTIIEPIFRDSDIVSIDLSAMRNAESPGCKSNGPNGFYADEICAISRYAGISDKLSLFGVFEYEPLMDREGMTAKLMAQMIWYFVEGVSYRAKDFPFGTKKNYFKYIVPHQEEEINFYKSDKSGRWWMEIKNDVHNKYDRHSLVPCTYEDYLEACEQRVPERWFKALKKFS
ncbi:formimidoylglutamase [Flavobacteriaceae bacterium]|nr:formimidoylglutamase [Flavobacteriaceae bacterium]